jgi:hypothetical protein
MAQVNEELSAIESTEAKDGSSVIRHRADIVLNVSRIASSRPQKLDHGLIALKGVREKSIRFGNQKKLFEELGKGPEKGKSEQQSEVHSKLLVVPVERTYFFQKDVLKESVLHTLTHRMIRRHGGVGDDNRDSVIFINDIESTREDTDDPMVNRLREKLRGQEKIVFILEIKSKHVLPSASPSSSPSPPSPVPPTSSRKSLSSSPVFVNKMILIFETKDARDEWSSFIQRYRDQQLLYKGSYFVQSSYLDLTYAIQCSQRFKKSFEDFSSFFVEERKQSIEACGVDVNDLGSIYNYLVDEMTADGKEDKLLLLLQQLLLISANDDDKWTKILRKVQKIVLFSGNDDLSILSSDEEDDDTSGGKTSLLRPRNKDVLRLLRQKSSRDEEKKIEQESADEETNSNSFSQIARAVILQKQEIKELKRKLQEANSSTLASFHANGNDGIARTFSSSETALNNRSFMMLHHTNNHNENDSNFGTLVFTICFSFCFFCFFRLDDLFPVVEEPEDVGPPLDVHKQESSTAFMKELTLINFRHLLEKAEETSARTELLQNGYDEDAVEQLFYQFQKEKLFADFQQQRNSLSEDEIRRRLKVKGLARKDIDEFFEIATLPEKDAIPSAQSRLNIAAGLSTQPGCFDQLKSDNELNKICSVSEGLKVGAPPSLLANRWQNPSEQSSSSSVDDNSKYEKYLKLRKMGLATEAVESKMKKDSEMTPDDIQKVLCLLQEVPKVEKSEDNVSVGNNQSLNENTKKYEKYLKLMKIGTPLPAIEAKMEKDGELTADEVKTMLHRLQEEQTDHNSPHSAAVDKEQQNKTSADDPKYTKYVKMKQVGIREENIKQKMKDDGLNNEEISVLYPSSPSSSLSGTSPVLFKPSPVVEMKLGKFKKMKKEGKKSDEEIKAIMREENFSEDEINFIFSTNVVLKSSNKVEAITSKFRKIHWGKFVLKDEEVQKTIWSNTPTVSLDTVVQSMLNQYFELVPVGGSSVPLNKEDVKQERKAELTQEKQKPEVKNEATPAKKLKEKKEKSLFSNPQSEQNAKISLARIKQPSELIQAVIELNPVILTFDSVIMIQQIIPKESSELQPFQNYIAQEKKMKERKLGAESESKKDETKKEEESEILTKESQFLVSLLSVPDYVNRLESFKARLQFPSLLSSLSTDLLLYETAYSEMMDLSPSFLKLFGLIISIGNYVSSSSSVKGITFDGILQVVATKTNFSNKTLMNAVIQILVKEKPSLLTLFEDNSILGIFSVKESNFMKIVNNLQFLLTILQQTKGKLITLQEKEKRAEAVVDPNQETKCLSLTVDEQALKESLEQFVIEEEGRFGEIESKYHLLFRQLKDLLEKFGESFTIPSSSSSVPLGQKEGEKDCVSVFFDKILTFIAEYSKAYEAHKKEEKDKRIKARKEQLEKERLEKKSAKEKQRQLELERQQKEQQQERESVESENQPLPEFFKERSLSKSSKKPFIEEKDETIHDGAFFSLYAERSKSVREYQRSHAEENLFPAIKVFSSPRR